MTPLALLDHLAAVPAWVAYAVVGALVFGESAVFLGFVLPGETAVLLAGALAATGHLSLATLLPVVVIAAIVGDTVGYEVGRHFGPAVLRTRPLLRHADALDRARSTLSARGGWAVFLGRFTAFLRAVVPGLAGLSRMPYRRFLAWNAAGGIAWGTAATVGGYLAGASYRRLAHTMGQAGALVAVVVVAALVAVVWWRRRRARRSGDAAESERHEARHS